METQYSEINQNEILSENKKHAISAGKTNDILFVIAFIVSLIFIGLSVWLFCNNNIYKGVLWNGNDYYITKLSGFRIDNEDTFTAEFDLLPDGQWYIIGSEIDFSSYKLNYCFVAKAVVTDNGNLDVYFGAYASNDFLTNISVSTVTDFVENNVTFYDCTVNNKVEQGDGGRRSEKNWAVVGTEKIKVDAFDALATYRFIPNPAFEGENIKVSCFKRR